MRSKPLSNEEIDQLFRQLMQAADGYASGVRARAVQVLRPGAR